MICQPLKLQKIYSTIYKYTVWRYKNILFYYNITISLIPDNPEYCFYQDGDYMCLLGIFEVQIHCQSSYDKTDDSLRSKIKISIEQYNKYNPSQYPAYYCPAGHSKQIPDEK